MKSAKVKLSIVSPSVSDSMTEPYTVEELHERVSESERQYMVGDYSTQEEVHKLMVRFVQQQMTNL